MKVLIVIDSLEVGGAELQVTMLASQIKQRGHDCRVFALRGEGRLMSELQRANVPVISGGFSSGRDRLGFAKGVYKLFREIRHTSPDVVHSFLPLSNFVGSIVGRIAGAKLIITSRRGLGKHQDVQPRYKLLDRMANVFSDWVTVNSSAVIADVIYRDNLKREKIVCIYNGLAADKFEVARDDRELVRGKLHLNKGEFAWGKVANLVDYKGHADLLRAFAEVRREYRAKLILIGRDRGAASTTKFLARDLGIADDVLWLGERDDVPALLSGLDGFVLASHTEGFSNALLEAMAAGLPIVATKVGGNAEALENGQAGLLVEPRKPDQLSLAMKNIMVSESLRRDLGAAARAAVQKKYSVEAMVQSYINLYSSGI